LPALQAVAAELTTDVARQEQMVEEMLAHLLHLRAQRPDATEAALFRECLAFFQAGVQSPTVRVESLTESQVAAIQPKITVRQAEVLNSLRLGRGIRETGRHLGISHVAILKHRRKIERTAGRVLSAASAAPAITLGL